MVEQAPGATHLLCVPFGCEEADAAALPACQQHGAAGSGRGALLFGFSADLQLDGRRRAVLAVLAQCLPAPMAQLSGDTLAFVNFATGSLPRCSCCCDASEDEEDEPVTPRSPCREHDRGGDHGGAGQPLLVPGAGPLSSAQDRSAAALGDARPSSQCWWEEPGPDKGGAKAAEAAATVDLEPSLPLLLSECLVAGARAPLCFAAVSGSRSL